MRERSSEGATPLPESLLQAPPQPVLQPPAACAHRRCLGTVASVLSRGHGNYGGGSGRNRNANSPAVCRRSEENTTPRTVRGVVFFAADRKKIQPLGRSAASALRVHEYMQCK